jgi:hypothetical protein
MLIRLKVRPEALTRQRIIFVMTGISPKGSTDRLTHARLAVFLQHQGLSLTLENKEWCHACFSISFFLLGEIWNQVQDDRPKKFQIFLVRIWRLFGIGCL